MENPYLMFEEGSEAYHRCEKFRRMEIGGHAALDWGALDEVDESTRARLFIGHDTPWSRLFDIAYTPSYRVMTCEFLSTSDFAPRPVDRLEELDDPDDPWIEDSFRLANQWHLMSLRQYSTAVFTG
ncbi:hypothetical protein Hdeb2414_s0058g00759401 [Helianthus debilis subsp. tardiflorus]